MTLIHSKAATEEYRSNWDQIFGKKKEAVELDVPSLASWLESSPAQRVVIVAADEAGTTLEQLLVSNMLPVQRNGEGRIELLVVTPILRHILGRIVSASENLEDLVGVTLYKEEVRSFRPRHWRAYKDGKQLA